MFGYLYTRAYICDVIAMKRYRKRNKMTTLNLNAKKVNKTTATEIRTFVYNNRATLSNEMKMFYGDVAAMIDMQLRKKAAQRLSMVEVLERSYNIDQYIMASGAISVETIFVG